MHTPVKTWLGVTIIIIMAISAGMFIWYQQKIITADMNSAANNPVPKKIACTMEAKPCPDGSYVSRTGPKCEFATCPEIVGIADKIIISAPAKDTMITSPVSISGKAIGPWFSEGSFPVEVYDANNKLLGQGIAEFIPSPEAPEWMTENFVNFSGSIKFSKTSAASGYILFKKDNPSDMRELDESFKLPVKFIDDDCAKEGESIGAVYPGVVPNKCCDGFEPVIPENMVGTQGICTKTNH
jgi:hypothetical protein